MWREGRYHFAILNEGQGTVSSPVVSLAPVYVNVPTSLLCRREEVSCFKLLSFVF